MREDFCGSKDGPAFVVRLLRWFEEGGLSNENGAYQLAGTAISGLRPGPAFVVQLWGALA